MNDFERAAQRELALAMLAQCDGEVVQAYMFPYDNKPGRWRDESDCAIMYHDELHGRKFRVKPKPRQRWICQKCNRALIEQTPLHQDTTTTLMCKAEMSDLYLSMEVVQPTEEA